MFDRDCLAWPAAGLHRRPWLAQLLLTLLLLGALAGRAHADDPDLETDWGPDQAAGRRAVKAGQFAEADVLLTKALEQARREGRGEVDLGRTLNWRGLARLRQARFPEAEVDLLEALRIREAHPGLRQSSLRQTLSCLGILEHNRGRFGLAAGYYRRGLTHAESVLPPFDRDLASDRNNLGELYRKLRRFDLAEPLLLASLAALSRLENLNDVKLAFPLNNLGLLRHLQGRQAEAYALHRWALEIWERERGPDHPDVALSLKNIALVLNAQAKHGEAESAAKRSLDIRERKLGKDHPLVAQTLTVLGTIARDQGQNEPAEALYRRALEIREQRLPAGHLDVAETLEELVVLLTTLGRKAEAVVAERRAQEIRDANRVPEPTSPPK